MIVCKYCLEAIESHEGKQRKKGIDPDEHDTDTLFCEWCDEETEIIELYEI